MWIRYSVDFWREVGDDGSENGVCYNEAAGAEHERLFATDSVEGKSDEAARGC